MGCSRSNLGELHILLFEQFIFSLICGLDLILLLWFFWPRECFRFSVWLSFNTILHIRKKWNQQFLLIQMLLISSPLQTCFFWPDEVQLALPSIPFQEDGDLIDWYIHLRKQHALQMTYRVFSLSKYESTDTHSHFKKYPSCTIRLKCRKANDSEYNSGRCKATVPKLHYREVGVKLVKFFWQCKLIASGVSVRRIIKKKKKIKNILTRRKKKSIL